MTTVKISQGDAIFCRRNCLLAVKFHDKRDVKMMSTVHSADAVRVVRHDRSVVIKPTSIADLNSTYGRCGSSDQLGQYFYPAYCQMVEETILSPAQPTVCGQCIYVICNKYGPKMTHFQFSLAMIKGLLEEIPRISKRV